ncbi:MAG: hypothetical protein D6694_04745 [Gammaproteobacteria bacterium]|nr:MAG: hypothetical protein D6694_04745 [Gammaproteobacteria bacterium]
MVGRTIDADRFVEPGESTLRLSTQVSSGSDRWLSNVTWLARDNADQLSLLYHVGASTWGDIALRNNQRLENSGGDDQGHLLKAKYRPTEADTFALLASRTRVTADIPYNAQSMAGTRNPMVYRCW